MKLNKLLSTSKGLWDDVSSLVRNCWQGNVGPLDILSAAIDRGRKTFIVDERAATEAEKLLSQAQDLTAEVEAFLAVTDALLFTENDTEHIELLWSKTGRLPIPIALYARLKRVHDLAVTLQRCRVITAAGSSSDTPLSLDVEELNQLKTQTKKQLAEWSAHGSFSSFQEVFAVFLVTAWRAEVTSALKAKATIQSCDVLRVEGQTLDVTNSIEWCRLTSELAKAESVSREFTAFNSLADGIIDESTALLNSRSISLKEAFIPSKGCVLDVTTLKTVLEGAGKWDDEVKTLMLREQLAVLKDKEQGLCVALPAHNDYKMHAELVMFVPQLALLLKSVHQIMSQPPEEVTFEGVLTLTELEALIKRTSRILAAKPRFLLVNVYEVFLKRLLSEANKWDEQAGRLLPSKTTRTSTRADAYKATLEEVRSELLKDIPRVIRTALQSKLASVLSAGEQLRREFQSMIRPAATSETAAGYALFTNVDSEDYDHDRIVWEEATRIHNFRNQISLLVVDMPEQRAAEWLYQRVVWMINTLSADASPGSMTIEHAQAKVDEAAAFRTPNITELKQMGVFGPDGLLCSEVNPFVKHFESSYIFLKAQLSKTLAAQEKAQTNFLNKLDSIVSNVKTMDELRRLNVEIASLIISPQPSIKRGLLAMDTSGADYKDSKFIANVSDKASDKSGGKTSSKTLLKRARSIDEEHLEALPIKKDARTINKDLMRGCQRVGCGQERIGTSSYCSYGCAKSSCSEMYKSLLAYRARLCDCLITKKVVGDGVRKEDVSSFALRQLDAAACLDGMAAGLTRAGYVAAEDDFGSSISSLDLLLMLGMKGDKAELLEIVMKKTAAYKQMGAVSLQSSLPSAASSLLLLANSTSSTPTQSVDADFRTLARNIFEDVFMAACGRLSIPFTQAVLLALEVEDELAAMYTETLAGNKKELNKKNYRQHQLQLSRNLKAVHNDRLVNVLPALSLFHCI
jgi:hypothetical protein